MKGVYLFEEGNAKMKALLGNKGAQLAEMTVAGLPVPPGFTITTEICNQYQASKSFSPELKKQAAEKLGVLEKKMGKKFGDASNPLLVSVRSGAAASMPGMMDTILNLGLNDAAVVGLAKKTNNERFAYDCYRRFIQMFGNVVLGIEHAKFEHVLDAVKKEASVKLDYELSSDWLKKLVARYKQLVRTETSKDFPQDAGEQLWLAIEAVFESWNNKRAITYRKLNRIPDSLGTAVNVQAMVFGNSGESSGTGVAFTRDPATGEKALYGEYLINAQGEDVVAGIRTPQPISRLEKDMPAIFAQFAEACKKLELHYRDVQDIEFTVEEGRLFLLQTRNGKRTAQAAIKIAADMVGEGLITKQEALLRVEPAHLDKILHPSIDPKAKTSVVAKGIAASPGAAIGEIVFDADTAAELGAKKKVMLVRPETTPDDIHGIVAAQGVLTSRGGATCHAAIVTRGMGKPCIVGCDALKIDLDKKEARIGDKVLHEGDTLTIDGGSGEVMLGALPLLEPRLSSEALKILEWADGFRKMGVRANADNPKNAKKARDFGAEGIGLCRTERMFNESDRLPIVQEMILSESIEERKRALEKLKPIQKNDFRGIFEAMDGLPVIIRLLDPPLHEFLPNIEQVLVETTELRCRQNDGKKLDERDKLLKKIRTLQEFNPMLGHRGCRLGITHPEIYEMQVAAIIEAAVELKQEGKNPVAEIMIPLVGHSNELKMLRERLEKVAQQAMGATKIDYLFGTMIEIPRACVTADSVAEYADFFSFGTNDLTQTAFGYSRDDAEAKFLQHYLHDEVLESNPFEQLDQDGVGSLVKTAVTLGRKTKPKLEIGVCGETGGDPSSIEFYYHAGLDYVSCSPFRVPIARLAAAQAALRASSH